MCVHVCVCICLSGDIIYEHKHDLRLELGSFILLSGKDGNNTEIFGVKMSPFIYCRLSQQSLLFPINNSNNNKKAPHKN